MSESFGDLIARARRENSNLKQQAVADEINLDRTTLSKIEADHIIPQEETARKLCEFLRIDWNAAQAIYAADLQRHSKNKSERFFWIEGLYRVYKWSFHEYDKLLISKLFLSAGRSINATEYFMAGDKEFQMKGKATIKENKFLHIRQNYTHGQGKEFNYKVLFINKKRPVEMIQGITLACDSHLFAGPKASHTVLIKESEDFDHKEIFKDRDPKLWQEIYGKYFDNDVSHTFIDSELLETATRA